MAKRLFVCLLAALMGTSAISCGSPATETTSVETVAETVTETEETELKPDLPEEDFGGYTYRILATEVTYLYIHSDEVTGHELRWL